MTEFQINWMHMWRLACRGAWCIQWR